MKFRTPTEVKRKGSWCTIELNEIDIKELISHHPLVFDIGGNAEYMITRIK